MNIKNKNITAYIKKAYKSIKADKSNTDYIYDPEHELHPSGGYHKTEKGWSKKEEKKEEKLNNKEENSKNTQKSNTKEVSKKIQDVVSNMPDKAKEKMAMDENCPLKILNILADDSSLKVRMMIAANKKTSAKILDKLSNNSEFGVRMVVAKNDNTSLDTLEKLSNDEEKMVRFFVAGNKNISKEILEKLANDEDSSVRSEAKENLTKYNENHKTEKTLKEKVELATKSTDPEELAMLANEKDENILYAVAGNENTPPDILEDLVNEKKNIGIVIQVAKNPNIFDDTMDELSNSDDQDVKYAILQNPNVTKEIVEKLAQDEDSPYVKHEAKEKLKKLNNKKSIDQLSKNEKIDLAKSNKATEDELYDLSQVFDDDVKLEVAKNPNTPASVLKAMVDESLWTIRGNIAKHPNATPEILDELAHDIDDDVAGLAIENPNIESSTISQVVSNIFPSEYDSKAGLILKITKSPKTSAGTLKSLYTIAKSGDFEENTENIVKGIASNKNTFGGVLYDMFDNGTEELKDIVSKTCQEKYNNEDVYYIPSQDIVKDVDTLKKEFDASGDFDYETTFEKELQDNIDNGIFYEFDYTKSNVSNTKSNYSQMDSTDKAEYINDTKDDVELGRIIDQEDDGQLLSLIAEKKGLSFNLCQKLIDKNNTMVIKKLAKNSDVPPKVLEVLSNHKSSYVREAVPFNKNVTKEIMEKLSQDKSSDVRMAVAENAKDKNILFTLSQDEDNGVRHAVAENKNTSRLTLHYLSKDKDAFVRAGVSENYNAPLETLRGLMNDVNKNIQGWAENTLITKGGQIVDEILKGNANDVDFSDLKYLALNSKNQDVLNELKKLNQVKINEGLEKNPNFINQKQVEKNQKTKGVLNKSEDEQMELAQDENTSEETLSELAKSNSNLVKETVAQNPNTHPSTLDKLADDKDWGVRFWVAKNPNTTNSTMIKLSNDDDEDVRSFLAKHPNISPELLEKMSDDDSEKVKISIAKNPNTNIDTLEKLIKDTSVYVSDAAKESLNNKKPKINENIIPDDVLTVKEKLELAETSSDKDILDKLANEKDKFILENISKNPNVSSETLDKLSNHILRKIRSNVAKNPNTSQDTLKKLADDAEDFVVLGVALNKNTSPEILKYIGERTDNDGVRMALARHSNVPQSTLEQLSKSTDPEVLLEVAKNPKTSNEILEKLANDNTMYLVVREEAKKNIEENGDKKPVVLKPASSNKEKAQKLLNGMSIKQKQALLKKEDCPIKIMEMLANTSDNITADDVVITGEIMKNPNCPESLKWDVINTNPNFTGIKATLAVHGNPTKEMMEKLAKDKSPNVRFSVAINNNVPSNILDSLSSDAENYIKNAVINNNNSNAMIIENAVKSTNISTEDGSEVALSAAQNNKTNIETLSLILKNANGHNEVKIKSSVAANPNTSFDMLKEMINGDNQYLQEVAHDYSVSRGFGDNLPKFKFKGDDKTYAIIRSKFEKQAEDKEQTDTIYAEMAMFSRDKVAPMGVYHGRTKEQLKADFIKNMNPANYESAESFHKAQERVKKLSALDFSRMLASIFAEDEEED